MGTNAGLADRILRLVVAMGALLAGLALGISDTVGIVFLVVAAIMLLTGVVGFCPLYRVFGINTAGGRKSA